MAPIVRVAALGPRGSFTSLSILSHRFTVQDLEAFYGLGLEVAFQFSLIDSLLEATVRAGGRFSMLSILSHRFGGGLAHLLLDLVDAFNSLS